MLARLQRVKTKAFVCTACGYCMPCPHGVDIPGNFLQLSRAEAFGLVDYAKIYFRRLRKADGGDKSALACKRCGGLPAEVPERLEDHRDAGPHRRIAGGLVQVCLTSCPQVVTLSCSSSDGSMHP